MQQRLWLIGEMGAGKSTTGRALAKALSWRYCDNDVALVEATDRTLLELEGQGAQALHEAERQVAERFFATAPPLVAGLAASVIDDDAIVAAMRHSGRAVYLELSEAVRHARIRNTARPWQHAGDPHDSAALHARRRVRFADNADVVVDATAPLRTLVSGVLGMAAEWWPNSEDGNDA